jgi:hypothetical protein
MRDEKGRFLVGVSGNPGGRPQEVGDVREMARDHTEEAIETLVDLMRHAKSDAARGAAAQALLDRGYGKSVAVALDVVDDGQAHLEALRELSRWDNAPEQKGIEAGKLEDDKAVG